jgi:hypothetical protein
MFKNVNQCDIVFLCNAKAAKTCRFYIRGFNTARCMYFEEMRCLNDNARLDSLRNELETLENYMAEF